MTAFGYSIGLYSPKNYINFGSIVRAAGCFGANMIAYTGQGISRKDLRADPQRFFKSIPILHTDDLRNVIPYGYEPIAVDLLPDAKCLSNYSHPDNAFYIFGPECGTIPKRVVDWCAEKISIPSLQCLNLAMAVNIVCYDRIAKRERRRKAA